jgi:hypothetical protein
MHVEADSQGKWTVPKIPNPEYKGIWAPRKIANPQFFEDSSPADFTKIGGIGIELWTMTEDILCKFNLGSARSGNARRSRSQAGEAGECGGMSRMCGKTGSLLGRLSA